jgi:hypothetical protein
MLVDSKNLPAPELRLLLTVARILRAHLQDCNHGMHEDVDALNEALAPWEAVPGMAELNEAGQRVPFCNHDEMHASDCARHNAPAMQPGACDCYRYRSDMSTNCSDMSTNCSDADIGTVPIAAGTEVEPAEPNCPHNFITSYSVRDDAYLSYCTFCGHRPEPVPGVVQLARWQEALPR